MPTSGRSPIDYDPSATKVNQENRIKLMLAVAKERLNAPVETKPLTAEEIDQAAHPKSAQRSDVLKRKIPKCKKPVRA